MSYEDLIARAKDRANIANVEQNDNIRRDDNIELRDWLNNLADAIATLQAELAAAREHLKVEEEECERQCARAERLRLAAEKAVEAMGSFNPIGETVTEVDLRPIRAARAELIQALKENPNG